MRIGEVFARLNRVQNAMLFKVIASIVIAVAAIGGFAAYYVVVTAPSQSWKAEPGADANAPVNADGTRRELSAEEEQARSALEAGRRALSSLLTAREDPTSAGVAIAAGAGLALVVVWLGLGLTYLGLLGLAAAVAWPLSMVSGAQNMARLLVGVVVLTAAFTALMQALRIALGGSNVVSAVARNVLAEAVRMKVGLVFIVVLIFGLAALPGLLNDDSPLRYRVQAFLQYATAGSFSVIALLVLLFSVSSVTAEQRERVIWQTMTKPVASWQYLLGKWVGVVGLAAVLLTVCAGGIFLFTEYLRGQPAQGEREAFVAASGEISEDRLVLETQVLAARLSAQPEGPRINEARLDEGIVAQIEEFKRGNPDFVDSPESRAKIAEDLRKSVVMAYRSIEPGNAEYFVFRGLERVKQTDTPITFRYRVNAGSNRPDAIYRITFIMGNGAPIVRETALGHSHTIPISPAAVDADGTLTVQVFNGDFFRHSQAPTTAAGLNPETISFPPGDLEVSFSVGSYRWNFVRVAIVLWVKLALLAMIAIVASTFLSFPVACLVALGAFMAAESSGFLRSSLEYFATTDEKGNPLPFNMAVAWIAQGVSAMFKTYGELAPTQRLVDGQLLSWASVAWGTAVIALTSAVLFVIGAIVFSRRELATYSGQ